MICSRNLDPVEIRVFEYIGPGSRIRSRLDEKHTLCGRTEGFCPSAIGGKMSSVLICPKKGKTTLNLYSSSSLVDQRKYVGYLQRSLNCKGDCQPKCARRSAIGELPGRGWLCFNQPCCTHPSRDDRVSGANQISRNTWVGILT